MAKLAANHGGTRDQVAIHRDAAANPGAKDQADHRALTLCRAKNRLGQGHRPAVVDIGDSPTGSARDIGGKRLAGGGQIGGIGKAGGGVDQTCGGHADCGFGGRCRPGGRVDPCNLIGHGDQQAVVILGRINPPAVQHRPVRRKNLRFDLGSTQINSGTLHRVCVTFDRVAGRSGS